MISCIIFKVTIKLISDLTTHHKTVKKTSNLIYINCKFIFKKNHKYSNFNRRGMLHNVHILTLFHCILNLYFRYRQSFTAYLYYVIEKF